MKYITITNEQVEKLVRSMVDTKDPAFTIQLAISKMREGVWFSMLRPMEAQQSASLDFLYSFVKCKDAFAEVNSNSDMESLALEDSDFELLYNTFKAFNNWNPEFARVILLASDALNAAKEGRHERIAERKTDRRSAA